MKKTITEVYKEREQQELEEGLMAGIQAAANVLGFTALSGMAAFGGAMLVAVATRVKLGSKIKNFFKRIAGKEVDIKKGAEKLRDKSGVKEQINSYKTSPMADEISDVLEAIKRRDYDDALRYYKSSGVTGNTEAIKIMSLAITEEFNEPPLYYISPGNDSYQFLKRIVGPRTAKAVSDSVIYALNKNKNYFIDIDIPSPVNEV